MHVKTVLKFSFFGLVFFILWLAYGYFYQQSLLDSGNARADRAIQSIVDGDIETVILELEEFAGGVEFAQTDPAYKKAVIDINYISTQFSEDATYAFVEDEVSNAKNKTLYSGVYKIPAQQGDDDFIVVVLKRDDNEWLLANIYLTALNPLETIEE